MATGRGPGSPYIHHVRQGDRRYRIHPGPPGQPALIEVFRHGQWSRVAPASPEARKAVRALAVSRVVDGRRRGRLISLQSRRGRTLRLRRWFARQWRRLRTWRPTHGLKTE